MRAFSSKRHATLGVMVAHFLLQLCELNFHVINRGFKFQNERQDLLVRGRRARLRSVVATHNF